MEKELNIKVKINTKFVVKANPKLEDWDDSDEESKKYYVKEQVKEFLIDNIDNIMDDLLDSSEIEIEF